MLSVGALPLISIEYFLGMCWAGANGQNWSGSIKPHCFFMGAMLYTHGVYDKSWKAQNDRYKQKICLDTRTIPLRIWFPIGCLHKIGLLSDSTHNSHHYIAVKQSHQKTKHGCEDVQFTTLNREVPVMSVASVTKEGPLWRLFQGTSVSHLARQLQAEAN